MDKRGIFVFIALCGLCAAIQKPELTITPPGVLKQGDDVVIQCDVVDKPFIDFIKISRVIDGVDFEISTNDVLKKQFEDTGRYLMSPLKVEGKVTSVTLTIKAITGADAGRISCKLMPKDLGAFEDIEVKVPPASVELKYIDDKGEMVDPTEEGIIKMTEGKLSGIICNVTVEGDDKTPDIKMTLDDKDVKGRFKDYEARKRGGENGFLDIKYLGDFEYKTSKPNIEEDGQIFKCSAENSGFPAIEKSATLHVLYPPKFECEDNIAAKPGTKDQLISCKIRMNPPPLEVTVAFGKENNRTVLAPGDSENGYNFVQKDLEDNYYEYSLKIPEIIAEDLPVAYKVEANNGVGDSRVHILQVYEFVKPTEAETTTVASTTVSPTTKNSQQGGKPPPANPNASTSNAGIIVYIPNIVCSIITILCAIFVL